MADVDAADFVRRFTEWWKAPDPTTLGEIIAADVLLVQPTMPCTVGIEARRWHPAARQPRFDVRG